MDWSDLRYVLALARSGSLVGAGRALGVEHTTVGRRIATLEKALGVRLFQHTPGSHQLTAAGERALAAAEVMERAICDLEAAIAGVDDRPEGVVRVTTSEGFTPLIMPHLNRLYAEHPGIRVEVLSGNRTLDLTRGEADVALRLVPTTGQELIVRRVSDVGWALYASADYLALRGNPGDPPDLSGHRVVGFDDPLSRTPGATWLAGQPAAQVILRGNSIPAVAAAVSAGIGLSCLPCLVGDPHPDLVRLGDVLAGGQLWLVAHPDRYRCARVKIVWEFLLDLVHRERALLTGVHECTGDVQIRA
jgi:DNA-binding transcriptional LysR family regulator